MARDARGGEGRGDGRGDDGRGRPLGLLDGLLDDGRQAPIRKSDRAERERVIASLRRDAGRLADLFSLPLRSVDPESPRVKRRYGICYDDGSIRIRLRHVRTGRLLKYSALVDTLCHELAHLRHFNHGPRFKQLYLQILARARREGIYRPDPRPRGAMVRPPVPLAAPTEPREPREPAQLSLF